MTEIHRHFLATCLVTYLAKTLMASSGLLPVAWIDRRESPDQDVICTRDDFVTQL